MSQTKNDANQGGAKATHKIVEKLQTLAMLIQANSNQFSINLGVNVRGLMSEDDGKEKVAQLMNAVEEISNMAGTVTKKRKRKGVVTKAKVTILVFPSPLIKLLFIFCRK